ncbi:SDR family oxidoreductase [Rhodococcus sp. F64268]|uniref:SDR family NAD(P)-dependent oxidoreductase n=1 Tax=Rhodococcus sp. F64268 TaxID=2926402 RepID=UPI001FF4B6AB|nr:SDR family oxidoreductase [Rhodococcus sp. F64268]MCK0090865.1 SDR family oxidoreductase [Rhodococcus sp. F64268]
MPRRTEDGMPSITDAFLVTGKVALVTGGGSGIGREAALVLAAAGAHVVATDVNEAGLAETRAHGEEQQSPIATQRLDVSDPVAVARVVDETVAEYGHLDILVNAAGIMVMRNALDVTPDELDRVLRINVGGTFYACQAAGRVMNSGGSIINLASSIIDRTSPGRITYAMSKGAIVQATRTFALELAPAGIRVNSIAPGWVETGMTNQHWTDTDGTVDDEKRAAYVQMMAAASPLGVVGTTRDIALTVLQLASGAGSFVTGQVVRINGGSFMA